MSVIHDTERVVDLFGIPCAGRSLHGYGECFVNATADCLLDDARML